MPSVAGMPPTFFRPAFDVVAPVVATPGRPVVPPIVARATMSAGSASGCGGCGGAAQPAAPAAASSPAMATAYVNNLGQRDASLLVSPLPGDSTDMCAGTSDWKTDWWKYAVGAAIALLLKK